MMSLMKQVSLLAAGCQPWNLDVCAADSTGERFAYCATLAVYVYEVSVKEGKRNSSFVCKKINGFVIFAFLLCRLYIQYFSEFACER